MLKYYAHKTEIKKICGTKLIFPIIILHKEIFNSCLSETKLFNLLLLLHLINKV